MKNLALTSSGLVFLTFGALFAAACGSEVNSSGSSGSSSSSSSSGSSSGDPLQDCADACHKLETMNCTLGGGTDCNTQCTDQIAGYPAECGDAVAAFFACLVQNTTTCDFPAACMNLEKDLSDCKAMYGCADTGTCSGSAGMGGEMSCGCENVCKGVDYSTNCTTPAGGTMMTCDCLKGGTSLGTCQQASTVDCGIQASCCNTKFFNL